MEQYQLFDALTTDEYIALKDDIKQRGVLVPIEFDDCGNILDGHHRLKAWNELRQEGHNIPQFTSVIRYFENESQKRNHIRALNIIRRHLTKDQRASQWIAMRQDGMSLRAIAETSGVDPVTVLNAVKKSGVEFSTPEKITGKDGKKQSSKKKPKPPEAPQKSIFSIGDAITEQQEKKNQRAAEIAEERAQMATEAQCIQPSDRWHIYCDDIKTWIAPRQYDFIITDPPYPKEYLDLYGVLAKRAVGWLKPGGLLVAMCGQSYFDQIIEMMCKHLNYYWIGAYLTPGQPTPLRQVNVNTTWKPLLIFENTKYTGKIFGDVFTSDGNDKEFHKWGQSISGMKSIVSKLCLPGQYILDPFCGAGTTGLAALDHGCLFDGLDIDEQNANISRGRLSNGNERA